MSSVLQILTCGMLVVLAAHGFVLTVLQILACGVFLYLRLFDLGQCYKYPGHESFNGGFVSTILQILTCGIFLILVSGRFVPAGLQIRTSGVFLCSTECLTNRHSAFDQMMIKNTNINTIYG